MSPLEQDIRACFDAGHLDRACTLAIEGYGPELLGLLLALTRDHDAAADLFSTLSEDLWRGLPHFRWEASLRTWLYRLAYRAHQRHLRDPFRRRLDPRLPPEAAQAAEHLRTRTLPHLRTSLKDRVALLRLSLPTEDQLLLTLRIDRDLPWAEIAHILHDHDPPLTPEDAARRANALRQRFHALKKRLRDLAAQSGLLDNT